MTNRIKKLRIADFGIRNFNSALCTPHSAFRIGYTTGTCAQAAAGAAARMLFSKRIIKSYNVETPCGKELKLKLIGQKIGKNFACCAVKKDSGDDPDVTHGAKICAEVRFSKQAGINIKGGKGVGKVTLPGLAVKVGEPAINPVPRKMIIREIIEVWSAECRMRNGKINNSEIRTQKSAIRTGLDVTISVPNGRELAKRTFNPKLGIIGGISIIGTSGIVEPKSLAAYQSTLTLQLDVLKARGYNRAVLVLGYVSEKFYRMWNAECGVLNAECGVRSAELKFRNPKSALENPHSAIIIGDHIGFMLEECAKKDIKEVLLIGHIGKLIKLTNNQFNTHTDFGDNRVDSIARYAGYCGADKNTLKKILAQKTAESAVAVLKKSGLTGVFNRIATDVSKKCAEFVNNEVKVNCIILSLTGKILGTVSNAGLEISKPALEGG